MLVALEQLPVPSGALLDLQLRHHCAVARLDVEVAKAARQTLFLRQAPVAVEPEGEQQHRQALRARHFGQPPHRLLELLLAPEVRVLRLALGPRRGLMVRVVDSTAPAGQAAHQLDQVPARRRHPARRLEEVRWNEIVADEMEKDEIGVELERPVLQRRDLEHRVVTGCAEVEHLETVAVLGVLVELALEQGHVLLALRHRPTEHVRVADPHQPIGALRFPFRDFRATQAEAVGFHHRPAQSALEVRLQLVDDGGEGAGLHAAEEPGAALERRQLGVFGALEDLAHVVPADPLAPEVGAQRPFGQRQGDHGRKPEQQEALAPERGARPRRRAQPGGARWLLRSAARGIVEAHGTLAAFSGAREERTRSDRIWLPGGSSR